MAYKDFINDFNKELTGDVLFFYGAEDYLMDWAINQVISKYVDDESRSIDVQNMDGDSVTTAEIIGASRAFSMFSERRVIVVRNFLPLYRKTADFDSETLLNFAQEKQDSSVVIFVLESKYSGELNAFSKKFIKAASSYEFDRLDKASLKGFINKRIHAAGKIIGSRDLDYLIDLSGYYNKASEYTLTNFNNDIEKIVNACQEDQIDSSLIEELLIGKEDKYVFNLVDSLMAGNKKKAMELAETIISEDDGSMQVLSLLTKQFEIMYDALELSRDGMSIAEIAKKIGVNEYRLKRAYQSARSYNQDTLKEILIKIYNIDKQIKTGELDKDIAFELLIVSI